MKASTEKEIEDILQRVSYCAIPISWRTNNPYPGVGNRKGTRRGPGLDFLGTALFQEGDDERHINWVATAQAGDDDEIYKTIYRQQKEIKAHIFVDVSQSMDYGSVRCTKRGVAAELAASALYALDKTRDKVGCTVFSRETVHEVIPTRPARLNLIASLVEILETDVSSQTLDPQPGDGFSKAVSTLPNNRQLIFVISDFMNMSGADWDALGSLATVHDVVCMYVQDMRERALPEPRGWLGRIGSLYRIQDSRGQSSWVWNNPRTRRLWSENWKAHEAAVSAAIAACSCELLVISTDEEESAMEAVLNLFAGHG